MKPLHYAALAPLKVAPSLAFQANQTLAPFLSYLKQAISAAKQRQDRLRLSWEKVRWRKKLSLSPRDTVLLIDSPPPRLLIKNWPSARAFDPKQRLNVTSRGDDVVAISVREWQETPEGPVVRPAEPVREGEEVYFARVPIEFVVLPEPDRPDDIVDARGTPFRLRRSEVQGTKRRVVVDGQPQGELRWGGETLQAQSLSPFDQLRGMRDTAGRELQYDGGGEATIEVEDEPADGILDGDNGVRYSWHAGDGGDRGKGWVQLVEPDVAEDLTIDPRTFFCDDSVDELWTAPRYSKETTHKVKGVDRARYRLRLDPMPPAGSVLYLPRTWQNLQRQRSAVFQLKDQPLPHHRGLLRVTEDPARMRRVPVVRRPVPRWLVLRDDRRSGTKEQRDFVEMALGTEDFAFLEGPPGSGKTTAICELILNLVADGKRVLLCGSTHYAIDNVLERLVVDPPPDWPGVEAVRIGRAERVDPKVVACQIDKKVEAVASALRAVPEWRGMVEEERRKMAERVVLLSANLTCGTTMGILQHPFIRGDRSPEGEREPQDAPTFPHWDVLIVDEASKTTLQEFLVPALRARRWIVVGDVQQLPPFTERIDLESNLEALVDADDDAERPIISREHQRAILIAHRLRRFRGAPVRRLIVEEPAVLRHLRDELTGRDERVTCVSVVATSARSAEGNQRELSAVEIERGDAKALYLRAADIVLVERAAFDRVERHLPGDLICIGPLPSQSLYPFRHGHAMEAASKFDRPMYERRREEIVHASDLERADLEFFAERSWAKEMAWRLSRIHELKRGNAHKEREKLLRQRDELLPKTGDVGRCRERVLEIQDIGLRSILETLKEGVGESRIKKSCLTDGFPKDEWDSRAIPLTYQHRMHTDISRFPRETFYGDKQLLDANTLEGREEQRGWAFGLDLPARRLWHHVKGNDRGGENEAEVQQMMALLGRFRDWARLHPRQDEKRPWEIACLAFYTKQEKAIRRALKKVTGQDNETRFGMTNCELVCGTVDRFQGREADLVLLSMRNVNRVGFLDSPNRLNVAVTRARFLLVVLGNRPYFKDCGVGELEALAEGTTEFPSDWLRKEIG